MAFRIAAMEIAPFNLRLKQPFRIALGTTQVANNVLVRLTTDDGVTGLGEGAPVTFITGESQAGVMAALELMRPLLLGRDIRDLGGLLKVMDQVCKFNPAAKAAVDLAVHDALGKSLGLPVANLLGGVPGEVTSDFTLGIDTPEAMAAGARALVAAGYGILKIKLGTSPAEDITRFVAIREAVGTGVELRVDANQGWSRQEAIQAIRAIAEYGVALVEQPVRYDDIDGLAQVRRATGVPIMADESCFSPQDAMRLIKADAVDFLNIKLMKCGGLYRGRQISEMAQAAGIRCMVGCMIESPIAVAGAAHLVAAQENITMADLDTAEMLAERPVAGGPVLVAGRMALDPDLPGLAVQELG